MGLPTLDLLIRATDSASPVIARIGGELGLLGLSAGGAAGGLGKLSGAQAGLLVSGGLMLGGAALILKYFKDAVVNAAAYQDQLARLNTILDYSPATLDKLGVAMLQLDNRSRFSITDIVEAAQELAIKGVKSFDQLNQALQASSDLATALQTPMDQAATIIGSVVKLFPDMADNFEGAADMVQRAVDSGVGSLGNFQTALTNLGPRAAEMGISFKDFAAALATMTANGANAGQAGTALFQMLSHLIPQTKAAKDEMQSLGLVELDTSGNVVQGTNAFFNQNGSVKSLADIAVILRDKLGGLNDEQRTAAERAIFTDRSSKVLFDLYKSGQNDIENVTDRMNKMTDVQDKAAQMNDTLAGKWEMLQSTLHTLSTEIGETFLPILKNIVTWFDSLATNLSKLDPGTIKAGVLLGSIGTALLVIGGLGAVGSVILPAIGGSLLAMAPTIGIVAVAVAGFTTGLAWLVAHHKEVEEAWNKLKDTVTTSSTSMSTSVNSASSQMQISLQQMKNELTDPQLTGAWGFIANNWLSGAQLLMGSVSSIATFLSGTTRTLASLPDIVKNWWKLVSDAITGKWKNLNTDLNNYTNSIKIFVQNFLGTIKDTITTSLDGLLQSVAGWVDRLTGDHGAAEQAVTGIEAWFAKLPDNIVHLMGKLANKIMDPKDGFPSWPGKIEKALANLPTVFAALGKIWGLDLVGGIVGGLGGLASAVGSAVTTAWDSNPLHGKIPGFATGGIVSSPTLAMVGEGTEPEAIMPLSKLGTMLRANQGNGGVVYLDLNIDGKKLANNVDYHLTKRANQQGANRVYKNR